MPEEKPIMRPEDLANYQAARHALDAGKKLACFDELLAACKAALPAILWAATHTSGNAAQFSECRRQLEAAIAKAEKAKDARN